MPLYDIKCDDCGAEAEVLVGSAGADLVCPSCGSGNAHKLMSASSSLSGGGSGQRMPGPGDHTCCGSAPGAGGCAGPGSCCGKA